jgi:hypothetical protein
VGVLINAQTVSARRASLFLEPVAPAVISNSRHRRYCVPLQ